MQGRKQSYKFTNVENVQDRETNYLGESQIGSAWGSKKPSSDLNQEAGEGEGIYSPVIPGS